MIRLITMIAALICAAMLRGRSVHQRPASIQRAITLLLSYPYLTSGLPHLASEAWYALLWRRCQVRARRVAGCFVTDESLGYQEAYNQVVEEELERRFGAGILQRHWREMEQEKAERQVEHQAKRLERRRTARRASQQ